MKRSKHHAAAAVTAVALSAAILLTGTFAWRSISQEAKNEIIRTVNPGGRLHDDFDGTNKDVYAENFFTVNEGGLPIYVRIRLDEYMETGEDAGEKRTDPDRDATSLVSGADINNVATWTPHIPNQDDPRLCTNGTPHFHQYFTWDMGGETVYLPTFNKNKDSLKADINGTWEGKNAGDADHYDDYKVYSNGQEVPGTAIYDNDANDAEDANVDTKPETHKATSTQNALVLSMKQWQKMGRPVGSYWVYDADGWAYWAQALNPGEATGLLLDGIEQTGDLSKDCYYSINVVAQFATKDDWGSTENPVGFYDTTKGTVPSENALFLLNQAADNAYQVSVTAAENAAEVQAGKTLSFLSQVTCMGQKVCDQTVTFRVYGNKSQDTKIDENGVLTVGVDEENDTVLQIRATAKNGTHGSAAVRVRNP